MGKAGPLGFGSKKEIWVFRGMQQRRPPSAMRNREGSTNGQFGNGSAHGHSGSAHGHGSMHDHDEY